MIFGEPYGYWLLFTFVIFIADVLSVWVEYQWFKPADTKAMAKQVKKMLQANLPKREAAKAAKIIDKAEQIEKEENA